MSKSDTIRQLAGKGLPVAEIARRAGVRYQHAYNVLKAAGMLPGMATNVAVPAQVRTVRPASVARPSLTRERLLAGGFEHAGHWHLISGELKPTQSLPKTRGVYAFVKDEIAVYVGLATMGLAKRLYFYGRPGATQRTSLRIGAALRAELDAGAEVSIYTAMPPDLEWNGFPVAGDAGLELGLIQAFDLPWNLRGT